MCDYLYFKLILLYSKPVDVELGATFEKRSLRRSNQSGLEGIRSIIFYIDINRISPNYNLSFKISSVSFILLLKSVFNPDWVSVESIYLC